MRSPRGNTNQQVRDATAVDGSYADTMTTHQSSVELQGIPHAPQWRRPILLGNVIAQVAIVVTGGLVRLTGSGLGCPTWPECTQGSLVPVAEQSEGVARLIEFGNRMLTFAVLVIAILALISVLRPGLLDRLATRTHPLSPNRRVEVPPAPKGAKWLAVAVLAGIFLQALLGGVTVLLDLHPATVAGHFLLSMATIAAAFVLYDRAGRHQRAPGSPVRRELHTLSTLLVGCAIVVLVLGTLVTGTGPHSGDADVVRRFAFDPRTISWVHADMVLLFIGLTLALLLGARMTHTSTPVIQAAWILLALCLVQGVVGYAQYFSGLPVPLVSIHMLGACLVWLATLNVWLTIRARN